jgi:autonomous glycyl radical cofactor GrcA
MIDYYLKFSSREWAFGALKDAGYTSVNEQGGEFIISATHNYCVDEIGIIYNGGKWEFNEQGEMIVIEQPVQVDGWHINIRILSGDIAENLRPYVIATPVTPYRIFG